MREVDAYQDEWGHPDALSKLLDTSEALNCSNTNPIYGKYHTISVIWNTEQFSFHHVSKTSLLLLKYSCGSSLRHITVPSINCKEFK